MVGKCLPLAGSAERAVHLHRALCRPGDPSSIPGRCRVASAAASSSDPPPPAEWANFPQEAAINFGPLSILNPGKVLPEDHDGRERQAAPAGAT